MTKPSRSLALTLAAACLTLATPGAFASDYWSAAGSLGVVDETGAALARQNNPALNFKTDAVGTIVARYPVYDVFSDPFAPSPKWFGFGFTDSGPNSQVVLRLYEEDYTFGTLRLVKTLDSNAYPASTAYQFQWITDCALNLSFNYATYWIEATITRTVATAGVGLRNIRMDNEGCGLASVNGERAAPTPN